jgi:hypothetical protein
MTPFISHAQKSGGRFRQRTRCGIASANVSSLLWREEICNFRDDLSGMECLL